MGEEGYEGITKNGEWLRKRMHDAHSTASKTTYSIANQESSGQKDIRKDANYNREKTQEVDKAVPRRE